MLTLRSLPVRVASAYLRTVTWDIARWRVVTYALRQTKAHGQTLGTATVKTHHGFKMCLRLHDWVDQHVWATGNYEDSTALTIAALLNAGDVAVDIGANIGFFTLLMAQRVGPSGVVWAFEPSSATRQRLLANIELNQVGHVKVRKEAISDREGEAPFFAGNDDHTGLASLRALGADDSSYRVRTSRLGACIDADPPPRLIKIDIEGAEHLALLGMREILAAHHPDLIIEMSDHYLAQMGSSSSEVYTFLCDLGYRMYVIHWDGVSACARWDDSLPVQFNALFTVRTHLPPQVPVTALTASTSHE